MANSIYIVYNPSHIGGKMGKKVGGTLWGLFA